MTEPNALTPLVKSLLDKPIHQLTEDDIAQLTREDCRRYLKDKGMRRPSWNKSQAIQQVIMLKSLLETTPDGEEAGSRKRLRVLRNNCSRGNADSVSENVPKGMRGHTETCVSAEETMPLSAKNVEEIDVNSEPHNPRTSGSAKVPMGQMTIFYSGKVNVFNDMPADKAQTIIHIAASPLPSPQEQRIDDARMLQPLASLSSVESRSCLDSAVVFSPSWQRVRVNDDPRVCGEESYMFYEGNPAEGPSSTRKASVQRYLEKKKDRYLKEFACCHK